VSYAIDISPEAAEDLNRLPLPVAVEVDRRLSLLAADPARLSQRSHFPYPINAQAYKFDHIFEGVEYLFHVLFKYSQDEQTLHILLIGVQTIGGR
jgi:hypothetical protein